MSDLNKVILMGRLTNDIETRSFSTGGMVAKFRLAVNNRKKNNQTGQWEEDPTFIDCEAYNRGEYKLAEIMQKFFKKGSRICIEGRLALDQWNDKNNGEKRQKHKIILEAFHFVDGKQEDGSGGGSTEYSSNTPRSTSSARSGSGFSKSNMDDSDGPAGAGSGGAEEEVPF